MLKCYDKCLLILTIINKINIFHILNTILIKKTIEAHSGSISINEYIYITNNISDIVSI